MSALDLDKLIELFNGTFLLEAGAQEWGYIDKAWNLAVPDDVLLSDEKSLNYWSTFHIGESPFKHSAITGERQFIKANFHKLMTATQSPELSLFGTMYRLALVQNGAFALKPLGRNVFIDEYEIVKPLGKSWDDKENDLPDIKSAGSIAAWAKRYSAMFVSQMIFMFSARGHHYTPEFNENYRKLQEACFLVHPTEFQMPNNEMLYRSFIHCLGVSPLLALTTQNVEKGKLPAAMTLRFTPHPPIAGCAHITTLNAILKNITKETLWTHIHEKFEDDFETIRSEVAIIANSPFEYHVSSKCLVGKGRRIISNQANIAFIKLSQLALGYLSYLTANHSLSKQKAVTAKSGGATPLSEVWATAFDQFGLPNVSHMAIDEFMEEMFPTETNRQKKMDIEYQKKAKIIREEAIKAKKDELEIDQLIIELENSRLDLAKKKSEIK
jgi:hypothetical protein